MKIQELPNKESLTHFNVQYYNNEKGQGSANHVVQVTYSTYPDPIKSKLKHNQRVVHFNLKDENKAINRLVKDHLGEAQKEDIKSTIKLLKKEAGIVTYFGFRRVQYRLKHKFIKGAIFHKNTLDPSTQVFMLIHPDNTVEMRFTWAGDQIKTKMTIQENPVVGQSLMYSYWSNNATDEEVKEQLERMKNGKECSTIEGSSEFVSEYDDDGAVDSEGTEDCHEEVEGTSGKIEVSGETKYCAPNPEQQELGRTARIGETSGLGIDDQKSFTEPKSHRPKGTAKRTKQRATEHANPFDCTADVSNILDQFASPSFTAECNSGTFDLGTSFRF